MQRRHDPADEAEDGGGGDKDEPEPEEDVDLLVEQVYRQHALDLNHARKNVLNHDSNPNPNCSLNSNTNSNST